VLKAAPNKLRDARAENYSKQAALCRFWGDGELRQADSAAAPPDTARLAPAQRAAPIYAPMVLLRERSRHGNGP
jgi:hypothetical protein